MVTRSRNGYHALDIEISQGDTGDTGQQWRTVEELEREQLQQGSNSYHDPSYQPSSHPRWSTARHRQWLWGSVLGGLLLVLVLALSIALTRQGSLQDKFSTASRLSVNERGSYKGKPRLNPKKTGGHKVHARTNVDPVFAADAKGRVSIPSNVTRYGITGQLAKPKPPKPPKQPKSKGKTAADKQKETGSKQPSSSPAVRTKPKLNPLKTGGHKVHNKTNVGVNASTTVWKPPNVTRKVKKVPVYDPTDGVLLWNEGGSSSFAQLAKATGNDTRPCYGPKLQCSVINKVPRSEVDFRDLPRNSTVMGGMVASDHSRCSQIGRDVLFTGGNAADAAVAVAFCLGVMNPMSSGLGGGAFIMVRRQNGSATFFDAREAAPANASATMYEGRPANASLYGGLAVGVPTEIFGLETLWKRYGRKPWGELVRKSLRLARHGYAAHPYMVYVLAGPKNIKRIMASKELREAFLIKVPGKGWRVPYIGEMCCQRPALADTLEEIANKGASYLRSPEVTATMAQEIVAAGGIMSASDLRNVTVVERQPLKVQMGDLELLVPPPPSSAAVVAFALKFLASYNNTSLKPFASANKSAPKATKTPQQPAPKGSGRGLLSQGTGASTSTSTSSRTAGRRALAANATSTPAGSQVKNAAAAGSNATSSAVGSGSKVGSSIAAGRAMNTTSKATSSAANATSSKAVGSASGAVRKSKDKKKKLKAAAGVRASFGLNTQRDGGLGVHRMVEALKHGFAVRTALGDPGTPDKPFPGADQISAAVQDLLSDAFISSLRSRTKDDTVLLDNAYGGKWNPGGVAPPKEHGTSHFCVVDEQRLAVSITTSINTVFGSHVVSDSTGILFGNTMDDFATPTKRTVVTPHPSKANFIAPGKRPLSAMSPIIVANRTSGKVVAVTGASGGPLILSATLQTLARLLLEGSDIHKAVTAPRVHDQLLPTNITFYENYTWGLTQLDVSPTLVESLQDRDHPVQGTDRGIGVSNAIIVKYDVHDLAWQQTYPQGILVGQSDPRKDGAAMGI